MIYDQTINNNNNNNNDNYNNKKREKSLIDINTLLFANIDPQNLVYTLN